jgi:hypothetical protein
MNIIMKDIMTVEKGIICQSVNCQGVMGSGLAKSIRDKWPIVYDEYTNFCKRDCFSFDFQLLGRVNMVWAGEHLEVFNLFGQLHYGNDGKRYTDYCALNECFLHIRNNIDFTRNDIYFPYLMGAGLGGGKWGVILKMIDFYFPNAIICKLPESN